MSHDLFSYPHAAGFKDYTTSRDAAEAIEGSGRARTLRERVEDFYRGNRTATADEVAHHLREPILAIRPRVSELYKGGKIERTGMRRLSDGGHNAHVYRWKVG